MKIVLAIVVAVAALAVVEAASSGACTDSSDYNIIEHSATFNETVAECSKKCLGGDSCTTACVEKDTGLSSACADCFGTLAECGKEHCALKCIANPDSAKCKNCTFEYCGPDFVTCSGIMHDGSVTTYAPIASACAAGRRTKDCADCTNKYCSEDFTFFDCDRTAH